MANQTRSKTNQDSSNADVKLDSLKTALATLLTPALEEQRTFIEKQFVQLDAKLQLFRADITRNTNDIKTLQTDQKGINIRVNDLATNCQSSWCKLEASVTELEDRSRRDNVRILNVPENVGMDDVRAYLLSSILKWFSSLAGESMDLMRAHRVGRERTGNGPPRTIICKLLRYTDRDRILKAAWGTRVEVNGREIRFVADYSNYTVKRRRAFATATDVARKLGYTPFLIYPARLKLTRGSEVLFFDNNQDAVHFLYSNADQDSDNLQAATGTD